MMIWGGSPWRRFSQKKFLSNLNFQIYSLRFTRNFSFPLSKKCGKKVLNIKFTILTILSVQFRSTKKSPGCTTTIIIHSQDFFHLAGVRLYPLNTMGSFPPPFCLWQLWYYFVFLWIWLVALYKWNHMCICPVMTQHVFKVHPFVKNVLPFYS